jgi:DNA-binding MarR family transcriptional regulator
MGLTVRVCGVLNLLADEGPKSQQEIGELLSIDRTTMVELIDDLEKAGIVRREANPKDRRSHLIKLTAEGKGKQRKAMQAFDAAADEFFAPLSAGERRQMGAMLLRLVTRSDNPLEK